MAFPNLFAFFIAMASTDTFRSRDVLEAVAESSMHPLSPPTITVVALLPAIPPPISFSRHFLRKIASTGKAAMAIAIGYEG